MMRIALGLLALGGCLSNPTVTVDQQSVSVARGASRDLLVSLDGVAVDDLYEVLWSVEDERLVTVTRSYDGYHLRVGGNHEGETVVHVSSHGQTVAIPTRVGPPELVRIWTEPNVVNTVIGSDVMIKAFAFDTIAEIQDVTFASRWDVRDTSLVNLDEAGMMLHAMEEGTTTLHVSHGATSAVIPVAVFK
jgi:Bacterial Ig-like domain (group 2)